MKRLLFLLIWLMSTVSHAQNLPACDSLIINCCTFDSVAPNTLTIYTGNYSSELFPYPGFILINTTLDTILATESVTYFGISTGPQPHTMNITSPLVLPFSGYLQLYSWFYDSLACQIPFFIPDTVTGLIQYPATTYELFPNPVSGNDVFHIKLEHALNDARIKISDVSGKVILYATGFSATEQAISVDTGMLRNGIYLIEIINGNTVIYDKLVRL